MPPRAADATLLPHHGPTPALAAVHRAIVSCERVRACAATASASPSRSAPRFATRCTGAGPCRASAIPHARLLVIGLAPAAHGANRTGRVFTGDGVGGSSDFLLAAMHASGFANQPTSRHVADGLELRDAYIAAAVRCAPPDNKPTPEEFGRCESHLLAEWDALPNVTGGALPRQAGVDAVGGR